MSISATVLLSNVSKILQSQESVSSDTKKRTLLKTDKSVAILTTLIPIALLVFTRFFNNNIFQSDSINCSPAQYRSQADGQVKVWNWNTRFYAHNYCWEKAEFYRNGNKNDVDHSLNIHKNFPYILVVLAICSLIPVAIWVFFAGTTIKTAVEDFGEYLEDVVKAVFRVARSTNNSYEAQRTLDHDELKVTQFEALESFIKVNSSSYWYITGLVLFRLFSMATLFAIGLFVHWLSIVDAKSTFKCNVFWSTGLHANETQTDDTICSVQGVIVRVWISWLWILGYGFLVGALLIATIQDLSSISTILDDTDIIKLIKIVIPGYEYSASIMPNDLKFITLLATTNIKSNPFIKSALSIMARIRLVAYDDRNFQRRVFDQVKQMADVTDENLELEKIITSIGF